MSMEMRAETLRETVLARRSRDIRRLASGAPYFVVRLRSVVWHFNRLLDQLVYALTRDRTDHSGLELLLWSVLGPVSRRRVRVQGVHLRRAKLGYAGQSFYRGCY